MRKFVVAVLMLMLAAGGAPAHADPAGCEVITIGNTAGACRYTATGPGTYAVDTLSGFRIEASDDGGLTFHALVSKLQGSDHSPIGGIAEESGDLKSTAGQMIQVSIAVAIVDGPPGGVRYQDGHIKAGDAA